jgi:hypothetical protein
MRMLHLLKKLQLEAQDAQCKAERQAALNIAHPSYADALYAADRRRLKALRADTASKRRHLDVKRDLEVESQRLVKVTLALQEECMSSEERKARDAEIDRMRRVFSKVCPEASPDWRVNPMSKPPSPRETIALQRQLLSVFFSVSLSVCRKGRNRARSGSLIDRIIVSCWTFGIAWFPSHLLSRATCKAACQHD